MAELKDHQKEETEGKLQFLPCLTLVQCTFASLKVHNLKVSMQRTHCIQKIVLIFSSTLWKDCISLIHWCHAQSCDFLVPHDFASPENVSRRRSEPNLRKFCCLSAIARAAHPREMFHQSWFQSEDEWTADMQPKHIEQGTHEVNTWCSDMLGLFVNFAKAD